ncbi:MAG: hypothetical protein AAGD38_24085, partial [Acidobacteriota bacterium]
QMAPKDLDSLLDDCHPDRRSFLKALVLGTAYAVPVITSFSMEGFGLDAAGAGDFFCPNVLPPNSGAADVTILKEASTDSAAPGEQIVYTISVFNCGPEQAVNVTVEDGGEDFLAYVSSRQVSPDPPTFTIVDEPEPGAPMSGPTIWKATAPTLDPGETAVFELIVQVPIL